MVGDEQILGGWGGGGERGLQYKIQFFLSKTLILKKKIPKFDKSYMKN